MNTREDVKFALRSIISDAQIVLDFLNERENDVVDLNPKMEGLIEEAADKIEQARHHITFS